MVPQQKKSLFTTKRKRTFISIKTWSLLFLWMNLLCIPGLVVKAQSFRGLPFIQTFGSSEYQAGIQNWDVVQDGRGFLYFANNFGLLEYDGHRWQTYPTKSGTKLRCLSIGKDGRIYVGTQNDFGYFSPTEHGAWNYFSLAEQLSPEERNFDETWDIYQVQNKIYFCTFQNIFVYDGAKVQVVRSQNPLEFTFLANNHLYVQDTRSGLSILENDKIVAVPEGEFFRNKHIVAILPFDQQQLLIVTQSSGLYLYNHFQLKAVGGQASELLSGNMLNCAIRLQDGTFAFGTQSGGLYLFSSKLQPEQHLDKHHGLNDHTILSLYQDWHQNLWIGHNNGISYVELSSPFTLLDEKLNVPGSGYAAYLLRDTLYLGTNNGLYAGTFRKNAGLHFQQVQNTQGQVYHVSLQGDRLLMGHHNGAFEVSRLQAKPISARPGVWQFKQLQNLRNLMLEGSYSGFSLYEYFPETGWKWKTHFAGFDESSRIFEEDKDGSIWMSHGYKGIFRLELNQSRDSLLKVRFYGQEDGLPSNVLNNLYKINNQLVFTAETGVYRYKPELDRFLPDTSLSTAFGKGEHIQKLNQDRNGNIYFIGRSKLGSIRPGSFSKWEADTSRFFKIHKLLNDDLDYLAILDQQNVLFGAKEGFIHFNPALTPAVQAPFHVYIRKVEISTPTQETLFAGNFWSKDKISLHQPKEQVQGLSYESNSIEFTFSAPFYDGKEYLSYQFMLENFDQDWSSWSKQSFKEYTNLPEGDYTFRVRARNLYGEVSPFAEYQFSIAAPWYRTPLAYTGYSVFAASLFLMGFLMVDRKHKQEKQLMTLRQKKALNQKEIELDKLSKRTEEEITRLKNEKLESEIRHKNKELATSTMHIVTKNEFIAEIKTHLNSIIRENQSKGISKELNKIIKDIDQNFSTDKDWEQFQIHFDRVHSDFSKRLQASFPNLTPQEMKLCAYLRLNLSTKEIAQLMHISVRGVEISRYRLRKKLGLDRQENLLDYILKF